MEKEKKMDEMGAGSEKKTRKKSVYENFDLPNPKRKELQKANGNNFSLLSKMLF